MNLRKFLFLSFIILTVVLFNSCKDNSVDPPVTSNRMSLISSYNTSGYAHDVTVYQQGVNYAFIADDNPGLQIVNVSVPSVPIHTADFNTSGSASNVEVAPVNNKLYAFVSDGAAGLVIIDVTQPQTPVLDTAINFPGDNVICCYIETSTARAYIGTYYYMYIYDISNLPNSINQLSRYAVVDNLNAIWVNSGVAYLAEYTAGIETVNVTNPAVPLYLGSFNTPGYAMDLKVSGHYAYIADYTTIQVLDVTNPFNLIYTGKYENTNSQFNSIAFSSNGYFYSGEGQFGVETIAAGTPSSPEQIGYYNTADFAGGLSASGNYVYVADGSDGMLILSYTTK